MAGNEGVGVVQKVGPSVKGLAVNDLVVPALPGVGTSRAYVHMQVLVCLCVCVFIYLCIWVSVGGWVGGWLWVTVSVSV